MPGMPIMTERNGCRAQNHLHVSGFDEKPSNIAKPHVQGFTLLEMLVALAIFSLAGLALVRLQAVTAQSATNLRERTLAQIVARNLMIERLTDPRPPAFGSINGASVNAGRQWQWRQGTAPLDDPRLVAITIRVDGGPGASPAVISFVRPALVPQ